MSTMSASPAEATADAAPAAAAGSLRPQLIWDLPVRLFHWLMVGCFAGAWLTAESERWRLLHVTLGLTMAGLVAWRLVWGLVGSRHARFASFVRGPAAVLRYLKGMAGGHPPHTPGHNPAGALAIVGMLALTVGITASGWALYDDWGPAGLGEWLEDGHEALANAMMALVGVHVAGVVLGSWLHRENLVRAMFSGHKLAQPQDAVRHAWRSVAALMLVAVLGFWAWQWQGAPVGGAGADRPAASAAGDGERGGHAEGRRGRNRDDDD